MKKLVLILFVFVAACNNSDKETESDEKGKDSKSESKINNDISNQSNETYVYEQEEYVSPSEIKTDQNKKIRLPNSQLDVEALGGEIDVNMDISKLSVLDLLLLRNAFAARQGYCFMRAEFRSLFSFTSWYRNQLWGRFYAEEMGANTDSKVPPITYTEEENAFISKLYKREKELLAKNFKHSKNRTQPNMDNVINLFQLEEIDPKLHKALGNKGFAIVPNTNTQFFHVYEKNDYQQFPNFVTTDMYLQLLHMYFSYVLRRVEEEKFIPIVEQICETMIKELPAFKKTQSNEQIKESVDYLYCYFSVAYTLLTDKKIDVPANYQSYYKEELLKITNENDNYSAYFEIKENIFPYSLFKPRGNYTRSDRLKKYFRAMMWLQTAPFCMDKDHHLKHMALMGKIFGNNSSLLSLYNSLHKPLNFIMGLPDNLSLLNVIHVLQSGSYQLDEIYADESTYDKYKKELEIIQLSLDKISPKVILSNECIEKINFLPQRYMVDNEILLELFDEKNNPSKRPIPKALDVFAAFGNKTAEKILLNEYKEGENWAEYIPRLEKLKSHMKNTDWNASVYNKWIESLLSLQKSNNQYPYFMQTPEWNKKNLFSSLASWAELKHDVILYAEQPMAGECGGLSPPDPYTVGYVEPNVAYWKKAIELLNLTKKVLEDHKLMTESIQAETAQMLNHAEFLLSASKKELKGQKLSEKEYNSIEKIGSAYEWMTLSLINSEDARFNTWDNVTGPDKSVSVIADVFTNNATYPPRILNVATGHVYDLFVVVEIEGYLYLTKGAVFSYHEFVSKSVRHTDEEWQDMLNNKKAADIPEWVKEIILHIKAPESNEKVFYSSGC